MLNMLLDQVKNAVINDPNTSYKQGDTHGLIGQLESLFGQHQAAQTQPQGMDPYGGVPNEAGQFGNVKSSNQDQYGDPADQEAGQFKNVKSSNQDPYGDPADGR